MTKPRLTKTRILAALGIAVMADLIQVPLTAMETTVFLSVPGEAADFFLDLVVMAATSFLLGFHVVLLPTMFVELIPGVDMFPTWTGCVGFVIWRRKQEQKSSQNRVIEIEAIKSVDENDRPQ